MGENVWEIVWDQFLVKNTVNENDQYGQNIMDALTGDKIDFTVFLSKMVNSC